MGQERRQHRRAAVLAAAALLAAGCGGDGGDSATGTTPSVVEGATSTTVAGASDQTTASAAGQPAGTGPSTTAAPTTEAAADQGTIAVGSGGVGSLAATLLQPGRGDRVVVEARAQDGAAPRQATLDHVAGVLREVSGKAVAVHGGGAVPGGAQDWTPGAIVQAAASGSPEPSDARQVVVRLLFLHGTYQGDTGVLGVAVAGDVAAVFTDQVEAAAGLLVAPAVVEDAVTTHELGHLLGLVDLVRHTGRADPAHPGHSTNRRSVMYWQVESGLIAQLLDGGIPRDLDDADRADLAAIRAG